MSGGVHIFSHKPPGYMLPEGKCLSCSGVSERAAILCYSCHGDHKLFWDAKIILKRLPIYNSTRFSFTCAASSNSHRRKPDFSRQNKGISRGRNRQNQERDHSENLEETDLLSSKNGPLLSLSSNPRYQATASPGQREREIVELFRKVQAQLRERAAVKEEKQIEASQGQGERGTVDSLLKLLRKHSVDDGKKSAGEEDLNLNRPERSDPFEDEQNSNFFGSNNVASEEEVQESVLVPSTRPTSNFQRKSPVPRAKYQPVYSAEESISPGPLLKSAGKKKTSTVELDPEPLSLDEHEDVFEDEPSDSSDIETDEVITEQSATEITNLNSLKLSELRTLAKSQGVKGYSKLKKGDLVELLSRDTT